MYTWYPFLQMKCKPLWFWYAFRKWWCVSFGDKCTIFFAFNLYFRYKYDEAINKLRADCVWISTFGREQSEVYQAIKQSLTNNIKELSLTESEYSNIVKLHTKLLGLVNQEFQDIKHNIRSYLTFNNTKMSLSNHLLSSNVGYIKSKLQGTKVHYLSLLKTTRNKFNQLFKFISEEYRQVFRLEIPILNFYNIYTLQSVKNAFALGNSDKFLEYSLQNISESMEETVTSVLQYISQLVTEELSFVGGGWLNSLSYSCIAAFLS